MSSRKYNDVIVFGPTGGVGAQVALEAHKRGAKVWLAMRDPSKTINEISSDVEKSGKFARVQADLTDPASIAKAIKESGAKSAYIYLLLGPPDGMRGTLQALLDAGVEHVVFLSSYSLRLYDSPRAVPEDAYIPYAHAMVEIAAEEVGFPYFTALRPGAFSSNFSRNFLDRSAKPIRSMHGSDDQWCDNITPEDMGTVGGAVLVERPSDGTEVIYLCGPELKTAGQSWEIIKKITGRDDIDSSPLGEDKFVEQSVANHMPRPVAEYLVKSMKITVNRDMTYPEPFYSDSVANIKKYSGKEPLKFADYVEAHKAEWKAL